VRLVGRTVLRCASVRALHDPDQSKMPRCKAKCIQLLSFSRCPPDVRFLFGTWAQSGLSSCSPAARFRANTFFEEIEERHNLHNIIASGSIRVPIAPLNVTDYMTQDDHRGYAQPVFRVSLEYKDIFSDQALHTTEVTYSYNSITSQLTYLSNYTKYT